jgi:hypothetical protein
MAKTSFIITPVRNLPPCDPETVAYQKACNYQQDTPTEDRQAHKRARDKADAAFRAMVEARW